jgi:mono/diheme cytochrome c family protein
LKRLVAILLASAVLTGGLVRASAQESGEPTRGLEVARQLCAACHAVVKGEPASPNILAPPFERVANVPGMTAMALNHLLHSSHETMPNVMVPPDDQWHLVAYILSLRAR